MRDRHLRLASAFPRKRLWPWVAVAGVLVVVGLVEVSIRAAERRAQAEQSPLPAPTAESRPSGGIVPGPTAAPVTGVSGVIHLPSGGPAPGVGVFAEQGGLETRSDATGAFRFPVPEGTTVQLHAHHSDIGFGSAEVVAPTAGVSITLQPRSTLEVRVMADGLPVSGAQVTVEETPERVYEADHLTDAEGRVRFRGLPAGQLHVRAGVGTGGPRGSTDADAQVGGSVQVTVQLRGP